MPRAPIQMSTAELMALPVSMDLVTAGRAHGLGRTITYELAAKGEFPCPIRKLGQRFKVTKADLLLSLGLNADGTPAAAEPLPEQAAARLAS